ncbi:hypothetical protein [Clostridium folliculivorans]|uniref:hypothetical protein n=1 Tax=Clostridium folliculivorans TaxID=2886038 RepID=UPI0021C309C2|nr:hypothetical protein [Clostridium folliculivorans]GKU30462.1 hypothetical protein CFB3_25690 [Clostridium folliculivorans]
MKKKILILLAIIIVCCGIMIMFFNKKERRYVSPIENPEKIAVYNKGTVTNISSSDDKYKKLVDIANDRIKSITGETLCAFMKEDLKKKSILLEFDYSNENKLSYWDPYSKKEKSITYSKLYF